MLSATKSRNAGKIFLQISVFILLTTQICVAQWFWQNPLPQGNHLYEVDYVNNNIAYAVGGGNTIIKSTDGGMSWTHIYSDQFKHELNAVYFLDENTGWVTGDASNILKTTNGGSSWIQQTSAIYASIFSIYFINASTGWLAGS